MSKWMPWELGVVDGHTKQCAVLPILFHGFEVYSKQEYLKLYPIIKLNENNLMTVYMDEIGFRGQTSLLFICEWGTYLQKIEIHYLGLFVNIGGERRS
jgi:hypothetical protein